jgi:hypothetical protein
MYDYTPLILQCQARELKNAKKELSLGSEILARLAKRMERDFYPKYQELAWQHSARLKSVSTQAEFDAYHHAFVVACRDTLRARSGTTISYGEAQQPVNIFIKEYAEQSNLMDAATVARLQPFLHVTLDGVMIFYMQSFFREDYLKYIAPFDKESGYIGTAQLTSFHAKDWSQSQLTQLLFMSREVYTAWQGWFRLIQPERPALLDALWAVARDTLLA